MDAGGESLQTLRGLMAPGGDLNKTFTADDMHAYDPGYAFRMEQAQKALQGSRGRPRRRARRRRAAIAGCRLSQNVASNEFGAAEGRFRAQQGDRFNRLNSLVNLGATTADRAAGYGTAAPAKRHGSGSPARQPPAGSRPMRRAGWRRTR
jgi:hypothetical protein